MRYQICLQLLEIFFIFRKIVGYFLAFLDLLGEVGLLVLQGFKLFHFRLIKHIKEHSPDSYKYGQHERNLVLGRQLDYFLE